MINQRFQLTNILINQLLLETILLMLSQPKRLKSVLKLSKLNQLMHQHLIIQSKLESGQKPVSLKNLLKLNQLKLMRKLQLSQLLISHLQLLVLRTQKPLTHQKKLLLNQFKINTLTRTLSLEITLLTLSLKLRLKLVLKLLKQHQNMLQLQFTQLKPMFGRKPDSHKNLLKRSQLKLTPRLLMPKLIQKNQRVHKINIPLKMLLLETTQLMLSLPKRSILVLKLSEPNQLMHQHPLIQLKQTPGKKLVSPKKSEKTVE